MGSKSYLTYDSDNELDIDIVDYSIHDKLTFDQIEELHNIFESKGKLSYDELRQTLDEKFNLSMSEEQFQKLFFKVNLNSDEYINWDEFVSFIIFCFKQDDPHNQQEALILPISGDYIIKDGCHKTGIIGMSTILCLGEDNEELFGSYLTVSKDGSINFWSQELEITGTGTSKCQYLKYTPTWVLGICALSDVRVICVSSTERELRFYDVMAKKFHLRLIIRSIPYAIYKMNYFYSTQVHINSKLLLGDMMGSVYVIEFSPILRGPFQSKANSLVMEYTWNEIMKGKLPSIIPREYLNVFPEIITDVSYSYKFDTIYISAEGYTYNSGLIAIDNRGIKNHFHIPGGVTTFALDDQHRFLLTGGPDAFVRLWDPLVSSKASNIFSGHHAGIIYTFIQAEESKCYSIDKAKIIKVWHLLNLTLIQTFSDLMTIIPYESTLNYMYNKIGYELIVGGRKLISIKCCLKTKINVSDGYTHTAAISVVLYNNLFENIVTCGLDSYIIVWDIWTGKRVVIMKACHTEEIMGETIDIEITAGTFDPTRQYLLTGARNGSLKIWDYKNAICIRNMNIQTGCEVTQVFWLVDRILAVGWNRIVTEFSDSLDDIYTDPKEWYMLHDDDILAAGYKINETIVTGGHGGVLILWKIDTGQPYRKFEVINPKLYIPLIIDPKGVFKPKKSQVLNFSHLVRHSVSLLLMQTHYGDKVKVPSDENNNDNAMLKKNIKKKNILRRMDSRGVVVPLPVRKFNSDDLYEVKLGIQAILCLKRRPQSKDHGSILVSLDNGYIQVYSSHQSGGYMNQFYCIHKSGDYCLTLATDKLNQYLFTGTASGYIKIWLLKNYCIPESEQTYICKPLLRLQFLFLLNDRISGRAKRVTRNKEPMLLNSYKAHLSAITSIIYIDHAKLLISGSNDFSVRMWTLGGRYLGTLGGVSPTQELIRGEPCEESGIYRIPPDINKVASSTTLKVLSGRTADKLTKFLRDNKLKQEINIEKSILPYQRESIISKNTLIPSNRNTSCRLNMLREPLLGKRFELNSCSCNSDIPILNTNLPHIPVYTHLKVNEPKFIERPPTPEKLKKIKSLDFMQYYKTKKRDK